MTNWRAFLFCCTFLTLICGGHCAIAQKVKTKKQVTKKQAVKKTTADEDERPNPFIGMPFKGGDTVTQKVIINVGAIPIRGVIKFEIVDDADGMIYQWRGTYRITVISLKLDRSKSGNVPAELLDRIESIDGAELKAKDITSKVFQHESDEYLMRIQDFNMDGKPDFAFVYDQGFHSNYVLYDIWVNINNRLVYWKSLSGFDIQDGDLKKRTLSILKFDSSGSHEKYYRIVQDTTLIPIEPDK